MLTATQTKTLQQELAPDSDVLPSMFSALADRGRFRMFKLLAREHDLCVTDLARINNVSVPAASQQLKILELSGLVVRERRGQMICYRVKHQDPLVKAVIRLIDSGQSATRLRRSFGGQARLAKY